MNAVIKEAIGYGAASLAALAADMGVLWVLVHFWHANYLAAATASFLAGVVVSMFFQPDLPSKRAD